MDGKVINLTLLSILSAALCVAALIYGRLIEISVCAGFTFGFVTLALARLHSS
jgi:hypothetical protein